MSDYTLQTSGSPYFAGNKLHFAVTFLVMCVQGAITNAPRFSKFYLLYGLFYFQLENLRDLGICIATINQFIRKVPNCFHQRLTSHLTARRPSHAKFIFLYGASVLFESPRAISNFIIRL